MFWAIFWVVFWTLLYSVDERRYKAGNDKSLYWMGFAMACLISSVCDLIEAIVHLF
jgi:hypothetical protein